MNNPGTKEALKLLMDGAQALADISDAGIRVDTDYLDKAITDVTTQSQQLEKELRASQEYNVWRREYGAAADLGSPDQLGHIFFDILKHPCKGYTAKSYDEHGALKPIKHRRYSTAKESFAHIDSEFVHKYFRRKELDKANDTYLKNIKRETCDGLLHTDYKLHTATTFRSSSGSDKENERTGSGSVNFQNIPIRNPLIGETIRQCFIPRKGRHLVEADKAQLEWRGATCKWQDPAMIAYCNDPTTDVHRDTAAKLFMCSKKMVSKGMRQTAKTYFVFPILYGSYFRSCCKTIWLDIDKQDLKLTDGTPVKEWLAGKGIEDRGACDNKEYPVSGSYEAHVKKVEEEFYRQFSTFAQKKEEWWKVYLATGGFRTMTGFQIDGIYSRNFLMNADIQGSCFHWLLWAIIEIIKWLKETGMRTKVVGTVHDSVISDVPPDELQEYCTMADHIMSVAVRKAYPCIIVDLPTEFSVSPVNMSWFYKKDWIKDNDIWQPKKKVT